MTTGQGSEEAGKPKAEKRTRKPAAAEISASKAAKKKEIDVSVTTTGPASSGSSATSSGASQKDFFDFLGGILPTVAQTVAPGFGIDPRIAGQTVSQVLSIFGIGGPGKAFVATIPKEQAVSQLQQVVSPHLSDPAFATALKQWLQAAVEPVQAHKAGKAYQPSVDLSKNWFTDAIDSIGSAVSSVDWGQVAQVGMQALPFVLSIL